MPVYTETKTLKSLKLIPDLSIIIVEHAVATLKDGVPISEKVEGRSYSNLQIADFEMDIAPTGASIADIVGAFNEAAIGQRDAATAALAAAQAEITRLTALIPAQDAPPVVNGVPQAVTMRQARRALLNAGLLSTVNSAIAGAGQDAQIDWEYSNAVERNSPVVSAMSTALSLTDDQIDALFVAAAAL